MYNKNLSNQRGLLFAVIINFFLLIIYIILDSCENDPQLDTLIHQQNDSINFSIHSKNVTGFRKTIVPDIVHLVKFRKPSISFVEMINIMSIVRNHKPGRLLMHCSVCVNNSLRGKYWDMLDEQYRNAIEIIPFEEPKEIFGSFLTSVHHARDVARIQILMKYGGIFLDYDVYVVKGLHGFRHFEMALEWNQNDVMGPQVLIAHKDARFLKHCLNSYKDYLGENWYYNAAEYATKYILNEHPEFIHRVEILFGTEMASFHYLYKANTHMWMTHYTIHLFIELRVQFDTESNIVTFDKNNIKTYNKTYGQMARKILFGSIDLIYN